MKVGLIGLGRMGHAMAGRFLAAGHDLVVYNRTPEKARDLAAAGARVAPDIAGACEDREVVVTMLANDKALEEVAFGAGGIGDNFSRAAVHIAMGAHGAEAIRHAAERHAEAGQSFVCAAVVGRPDVAAAGLLGPSSPARLKTSNAAGRSSKLSRDACPWLARAPNRRPW